MNPNKILQMAWKYISPKAPDAGNILNKAMEIGQHQNSPAAVMSVIEKWAASKGKGGILENNQVWNSFKQKSPDDIMQHGEKLLKESGKLGFIMDLISGNKSQ